MATSVVLKAAGLITSPNELERSDGALIKASDVVIRRDGIIESRRGFKVFGNTLTDVNELVKQMDVYRERILRHSGETLSVDTTGLGVFQDYTAPVIETEAGLRIKFAESNGNLYFTTADGIKKLSAKTSAQLTDIQPEQSGAAKALDVAGRLIYEQNNQSGFLTQDSVVAYRVVWNKKDNNGNLITGSPSQRELVYNPLAPLITRDFARTLQVLDDLVNVPLTTARINDKNYYTLALPTTATAGQLRTNLIALATKLDNDILIGAQVGSPLTIASANISSGICTITFSVGDPTTFWNAGDRIFLAGFTPAAGTLNGAQSLSTITSTTVTFNTTATGAVVLSSATINSNEYRSITQPDAPQIPATNDDLVAIQNYLDGILQQLQLEPDTIIAAGADQTAISSLDLTTSATVELSFTIPEEVIGDSSYFYQIYRSAVFPAVGTSALDDVFPDDELQLVYEDYPTPAEVTAGDITVIDITPDDFRGATLYTNGSVEGITQSNDQPPFAMDITRYRNCLFFANTRTKHRLELNMLGVQQMINDYDNGITPKLTIATTAGSQTYSFVTGQQEVTLITPVADVAGSLNGKYFYINSLLTEYYVLLDNGTAVDPAPAGKTKITVPFVNNDSAITIATKLFAELVLLIGDFTVSQPLATQVQTITNDFATITDAADVDTGFTISVTQQGRGEDAANKQVLLSPLASPARAVDATAKSLIRVINQNDDESVYAYYLSSVFDIPGKMLLEARTLDVDATFYVVSNNDNTGDSFSPTIAPETQITNITINPTVPVITTADPHGAANQDQVILCATNSTPAVDGIHSIFYINANQFGISSTTTVAGTTGSVTRLSAALTSENEEKINRVYYSKFQQPEAVPIVNYFDVGAQDKKILRVLPLRDSLFVFKEDGLYRISGDSAPFQLELFDNSFITLAPDSTAVCNNVIYSWTSQGVQALSEGGSYVISRPIDNMLLRTQTYTNFKTLTWGVGYESDNSYLVFTLTLDDRAGTETGICYRYCTLTQTWTTYDKSSRCGVINNLDDKLYLGCTDIPFIEQERKMFDRTDYADREYTSTIGSGTIQGDKIILGDITAIEEGDVVVQDQTLTVYGFNQLLQKLDLDTGIADPTYFSTLEMARGDSPRNKLVALAAKLDAGSLGFSTYSSDIASLSGSISAISAANPTVITSNAHGLITGRKVRIFSTNSVPVIDGEYEVTSLSANTFSIPARVTSPGTTGNWQTLDIDFADIQTCHNSIVSKLNLDTVTNFANYTEITDTTIQEAIVASLNTITKTLTMNLTLDYVVGAITIYKAIKTEFIYSPNTMGDPLNTKHLHDAKIFFETRTLTGGILSFATDLLPEFVDVEFNLDGNGIFGHSNFGTGFFGGSSNAAPFRTYVPRQCQRCRYIVVKFQHSTAREEWRILGIAITGADGAVSFRGYR